MAISRVIEVSFRGSSVALVRIDTAYFYNNGILFKPTDIDLPASYQVHWADSPQAATTIETIGTAEGAPIPDDLWNRNRVIYGWIYLHPTNDSSITGYEVRIYKNVRAGLPDGTEPTPAEQSTIDQLIGALNSAVEQTGEDVESADQSARSASGDADRAESARDTAQTYANNAQTSATQASTSASQASTSATASAESASASAQIKADVEDLADDAQASANASAQSASQASASEQGCARAVLDAASAAAIARARADEASGYAQTASTKASEAVESVETASQKATESAQSASQALGYKNDAESAKTASQTAQGLAESARDTAVSAKTDAESARDDAESARDEAQQAVASISGALDDKAPVITDTASGAIASFSDGADNLPLKSLVVDINPVQDLHGQDSPYPAGGGKNKLPLTVDGIKALNPNTRGTWTGNSYICRGITYTLVTDSDGNIIKIHVSGTRTGASYLDLAKINSIPNGTYIINGGITGVFVRAYHFNGTNIASSAGADTQFTSTDEAGNNTFDVVTSVESEVNVDVFPMVRMATESDSTFSPYENLCPISGWTEVNVEQRGKNLFDEDWESGSINGATGAEVVNSAWSRSANYIPIKPQVQYYFFADGITSTNNAYVFYYRADKSYISNFAFTNSNVFTPPANCAYIRAQYKREISVVNDYAVSINYPSTDHDYHPYTGRSITINLGQTVYGGKLDVLTGILTVYPYYDSYNGETLTGEWISDRDKYVAGTTPTIGAQVVNIGAQGVTVQLEPHEAESLYGVNNLWADSGDTEVEYRADTKLFIERLTAPDSADMIADANITSGQYFMVGNSLFKATANIANGSAIVVGTNCIRKSLSEALNEINA